MHTNKIAIFGALVLSFIIMTTGFQMSSTNVYHVPQIFAVEMQDEIKGKILPAMPITYDQLAKSERKQIDCLAKNIYYEAGYEPRLGWTAVAAVTMNRVLSGNYADTVCGVVYQNNGRTYQFSWVGMKNRLSKINEDVYNEILKVATNIYLNYNPAIHDPTKGATYYHADYVNPRWKLEKVKKIGAHIFYRHKQDVENIGIRL